jgi:hypothetical protein
MRQKQSLTRAERQAVATAICGKGGTYSDDLAALPPVVAEQQVEELVSYLAQLDVPETYSILICDLFGEGESTDA